jgi:hypothetical protein
MTDERTIECLGGENMVSYLYGEMDVACQTMFDLHLSDCTDCTDRFAAIANSRFSVYEWQKIEFAPLETPRFVIPYEPAKLSAAANWRDIFRTVFSPKGQWATAGVFAVVLVAAVFAIVIFDRGPGGTDIGMANVSVSEALTTEGPVTASLLQSPQSGESDERAAENVDTFGMAAVDEGRSGHAEKPKGVYQNTVNDSIQTRSPDTGVGRSQPAPVRNQTINIRAQSAPRLHEFDDVADDGLRLADLFDDTEASD